MLKKEEKLKAKEKREDMPILNAEFQKIARRDKINFLSDQCKEIEENNRMGKTRDLFQKIKDTKGNVHAKMESIKDRHCMDLTEPRAIKKRWQEYTEELYEKDLHDPDNHDGLITHLEPDILECEVKWALGGITTNKAGRGDGIPAELFLLHQFWEITLLLSVLMNLTTADTPFKWNHRIFVFSCQVYFT